MRGDSACQALPESLYLDTVTLVFVQHVVGQLGLRTPVCVMQVEFLQTASDQVHVSTLSTEQFECNKEQS